MRWIIDGNNVMGAGGDGWWNDPPAAAARLTQQIAEWCRTHDDPVTLVFDRFDGSPRTDLAMLGGGNLEVTFATRGGRDAADDRIVELVGEPASPLTVVTSDRGLRRRLPPGVVTEGAGFFRGRIGGAPGGSTGDRRR